MATVVTRTLKPSGGDYTSLSAWEAGEQRDLVTANEIARLECYKGDYSSVGGGINYIVELDTVTVDGWVTGPNNYIEIVVPSTERHDGKPFDSSSNYSGFAVRFPNNWDSLDLSDHFIDVYGLIVDKANSSGGQSSGSAIVCGSGDTGYTDSTRVHILDSCIALNAGSSGIALSSAQRYLVVIVNCVASGCVNGFYAYNYKISRFYNCTSVGNTAYAFRIENAPSTVLRNCLGANSGTSDFYVVAGDVDYCASSDASALGANSYTNQTFSFVDAANKDFHLTGSDTGAKDKGLDLSSDPDFPFNWDIDGETRAAPWDIGADEYVSGGGATTYTRTLTADALLQQQNLLRTASADAMVAKAQQLGAFADALVQLAAQLNLSADALLQGTNSQQALADLLVRVQQSVSAAADLRIASVQQLQALADMLLQAANTRSAQADLAVQARQVLGTSADLLVRMTAELVASADMIVQSSGATTYLRTAVVDMLVEKLQQIAVQADVLLQRQGATVAAQADVAVAVRQALSAAADAMVQQSKALALQADALLRGTVRALAQVDALLQVPRTASLAADLRVVLRALLSVGCNVLVRATRRAQVGVDLLALLPPGVWQGESAAASPSWTADSGALSPWTLETGKSDSWN